MHVSTHVSVVSETERENPHVPPENLSEREREREERLGIEGWNHGLAGKRSVRVGGGQNLKK